MASKLPEAKKPGHDLMFERSLHTRVKRIIDDTLPRYEQMVREAIGPYSPEAAFALTYGLMQRELLRPFAQLGQKHLNLTNLLDATGGEAHNPHIHIDAIGTVTAFELIDRFFPKNERVHVFIEEAQQVVNRHGHPASLEEIPDRRIDIDPLDGSGQMGIKPYQATGVIVTDGFGQFQAGTTTGIVLPEVLVVNRHGGRLFHLADKQQALIEVPVRLDTKHVPRPIRVSTLQRRVEEDEWIRTLFEGKKVNLRIPSFGGYVLLRLLKGDLDVMWDPRKGQNPYETRIWGMQAEAVGAAVTTADGDRINYPQLMKTAFDPEAAKQRTRIVISRNPIIHRAALGIIRSGIGQLPLAIPTNAEVASRPDPQYTSQLTTNNMTTESAPGKGGEAPRRQGKRIGPSWMRPDALPSGVSPSDIERAAQDAAHHEGRNPIGTARAMTRLNRLAGTTPDNPLIIEAGGDLSHSDAG